MQCVVCLCECRVGDKLGSFWCKNIGLVLVQEHCEESNMCVC